FAACSVHPAALDAAAEIDRVTDAGARMLALDPVRQRFDVADPKVAAVVQRAGERGLVVLMEADGFLAPGVLGKILTLSFDHPQTQFIIGHMGLAEFDEA